MKGEDRGLGSLNPIRAQLRSSMYRGFQQAAVIVFRRGDARRLHQTVQHQARGLEG
jgi:hypothetical protein